ncbi:tyrosine-protein phosphatase [Acrasis kona]|uniref:Tyrosine-protein phosphatase n=1 Tax=Acrasis kona TaxID=1008807 RepID=A0AAW2YYD8_9EUKA
MDGSSWISFNIPEAFGLVENGVYRSSLPDEQHFSYIKTLNLKTILFLSQEVPVKSMQTYVTNEKIKLINLGLNLHHHPNTLQRGIMDSSSWRHCRDEMIQEALSIILNKETHPIMIVCTSGLHLTGTVVGCIRRLQNWSLTSILDEYECYAGKESRYSNQQFIELFDPDLVPLSHQNLLPSWLVSQREMMRKEKQYFIRNRSNIITKSNEVRMSEKDKRLAFQEYYYCEDGPLISNKSTFTEDSIVEEDDD